MEKKLVLGSGSPRRQELLAAAGYSFEVRRPEVEEIPPGSHPIRELAVLNAVLKARSLEDADTVVLAADTLVGVDGDVLGKPATLEEGTLMLERLAGRVHEVCTGVCVRTEEEESVFFEVTWVKFRKFGEAVIAEYHDKVEVLDKAGGYAIQEYGEMLVEEVEGDHDNVVGLPVERVKVELERFGLRAS
jgi:septum formation protein